MDINICEKILEPFIKENDLIFYSVELTKEAKDYVIENSYDEKYGARPIKRFITKNVETLIAEELLKETIHEGDILKVDYCDKFILNNSKEIE